MIYNSFRICNIEKKDIYYNIIDKLQHLIGAEIYRKELDDKMEAIFISGHHGCGKTALIKHLSDNKNMFVLDNFKINFIEELPTISKMNVFEECLFRLYHRFYTAKQALLKCKDVSDRKILVVDRSIYDSMVYNKVEYSLGRMTLPQYNKLTEIATNCLEILNPNTVILNPDPRQIVNYLKKRQELGERKERDKFCAREDSLEYISMMNKEYTKFYPKQNILAIRNVEEGQKDIYQWIEENIITKQIYVR